MDQASISTDERILRLLKRMRDDRLVMDMNLTLAESTVWQKIFDLGLAEIIWKDGTYLAYPELRLTQKGLACLVNRTVPELLKPEHSEEAEGRSFPLSISLPKMWEGV